MNNGGVPFLEGLEGLMDVEAMGEIFNEATHTRLPIMPDIFYDREWFSEQVRSSVFTVSSVGTLSAIVNILASLDEAVREGQTFEQWRNSQPAIDAALSRSRLDTIFRNASNNEYMRGQCIAFDENREFLPFLEYVAIDDDRLRDDHKAMDGTILPVDDAWWARNMPPNGHNCRCTVIALTDSEARRKGVTVEPIDGHDEGWANSPCEHHNTAFDTNAVVAAVVDEAANLPDDDLDFILDDFLGDL